MQRIARAAVATCGRVLVLTGLAARLASAAPGPGAAEAPPVFGPVFAASPLDTIRVTGGYAEVRAGHFHGGFDFSTSRRVGWPVHAPAAGTVERVRASGVGYGRSLYLRADDGRLFVFGHLDAFSPGLAAYVDSAQRDGGVYERDLWPPAGRFRFRAGDVLAWSGQSGAGPPHLHLEVRHGDFAVHPLRSGFVPPAIHAPRLVSLALEPLDQGSRVEGGMGPRTFALRAAPETLEVEGRLRAVVRSMSGVPGAGDAPAWSTSLEWNGESVEARLDSISWAGEMSQVGLLVDRGRIAGSRGWLMWAPPGFRPRFLRTSAPLAEAAGVIRVARGDPPRPLRIVAREPGGEPVERTVVLRPPAGDGPPPLHAGPVTAKAGTKSREPEWRFAVLPGQRLRVRVTSAPAGLTGVALTLDGGVTSAPATWDGHGWVAIAEAAMVGVPAEPKLKGRLAGAEWSLSSGWSLWRVPADAAIVPAPGMRLEIAAADLFQPELLLTRTRVAAGSRAQGLEAAGTRLELAPADLPFRRSLTVVLPVGEGEAAQGLGVYRRGGSTWDGVGGTPAEANALSAVSSDAGDFAVMRDTLAPWARVHAPVAAQRSPYSRWQLVAGVTERGSGVDASASAFEVDGVRVPTEWDPEAKQLRWRPLVRPAAGTHHYVLRVVDRAGNAATRRGTFVLDSGGR